MKNKLVLVLGFLVVLGFVSTESYAQAKSVPKDGIYTFNPRPQATQSGQSVAAYLDKVIVKNGYATFYITSVPTGKGNTSDIPGAWGTGSNKGTAVLRNLDSQDLTFQDVEAAGLITHTSQYVSFDSVIGNRFTLRSEDKRPPIVFSEIVLRETARTNIPVTNFIYEMAGFDRADFTEMPLAGVLALTKTERQGVRVDGYYVSDVIFASQSGTNLTYKTADGKDSQEMQIKTIPAGLVAGQKVRIYYYAKYTTTYGNITQAWGVYAIEKL
jgi:hypothetical protein